MALKINLKILKNEINNNIREYLIDKNKKKQILGDIEVPLNICVDILQFVLTKKSKTERNNIFAPINEIINSYNIFIQKFTNSNYNNIELILEHLPNIINKLFSITNCLNDS